MNESVQEYSDRVQFLQKQNDNVTNEVKQAQQSNEELKKRNVNVKER